MKKFKEILTNLFLYKDTNNYDFSLSENSNVENVQAQYEEVTFEKTIYSSLDSNLKRIKSEYNTLINSDIVLRNFKININQKEHKALLLFIDGMVDSESINNFVLKPLMEISLNSNTTKPTIKTKANFKKYISNLLIPQCSLKELNSFEETFSYVNAGDCALFIDSLPLAFIIDVKGYEFRSISEPKNEMVVRGSQEAFVEKLRTNTSMIRRLISNKNLIIENSSVGKISKTKVSICYLKNIANNDLVAEVKYRINNLEVDNIISSGQLEQLIQDNGNSLFPQIIATERPDKAANHLLEGRVIVLVNGSPYCLIMPGVFIDFLASPEDVNLKYQYSNLLKVLRIIAFTITLFLPGFYVAITNYHTELFPTELLFTIAASRNTVPFPVIFEIILMELSFELIREAGLRVPTPIGPTIRNCWCFNFAEMQQLVQI